MQALPAGLPASQRTQEAHEDAQRPEGVPVPVLRVQHGGRLRLQASCHIHTHQGLPPSLRLLQEGLPEALRKEPAHNAAPQRCAVAVLNDPARSSKHREGRRVYVYMYSVIFLCSRIPSQALTFWVSKLAKF